MAYQSAANVNLVVARETTEGTAAASSVAAYEMRVIGSPGLEFKRALIQSQEKRDDQLKSMGRLGGYSVDGSCNAEITIGGATDMFLESMMRTAWATATSITFATMTSITVGSNEVVAAGGSWITQGIRVGDIFTLSNYSTAANNSLNTRVTALTTLTLSVATGTFTAGASDATGTLTVLKKLSSPTTPTNYSHTVEQRDADIDASEIFRGVSLIGVDISLRPNAMSTITYRFMGLARDTASGSGSPYFTNTSVTSGLSLIADDSAIRYNGAAASTFTSLDLQFNLAAKAEPVIGSFQPPAVFKNDMTVTGSIAGLRSDLSNLTLYDAETEFEVSFKLEEPGTAPKSCLAFFFPRVKIGRVAANYGGDDGAKIETLELMIAPKATTTGYNTGICTIHSSAA